VIVVDHAYHGHTCSVIDISPYKFDYPSYTGGKPTATHKVPCPDVYRGRHRGADAGEEYAKSVENICKSKNVAAFFIESGMSVAGVITPPAGYLPRCYAAVRGQGGVCVADEVQTGLGRFGEHWWGFETYGVVPDIVTCGKPFGNGMPLAAVICTQEIADAFSQGPEYFNTFGGNPVCCAAGLAVLDQIEQKQLRRNAVETGDLIRQRLRKLAATEAGKLIGDVRGSGLFIGIELVRDRTTLQPAREETSAVVSHLLNHFHTLTSCDGPCDNVIVMKPPLVFGPTEANVFLDQLEASLVHVAHLDLSKVKHTPT